MHNKIDTIRRELIDEFVERDDEITGTLCAVLSKQHLFMVGKPGTAKSMLIDTLCKRIEDSNYFQWLLTKFSTPEEVFGPISLKALENDKYTRITTQKLPEAHIGFLDEIFKANSAILNALLTIANERKFHNNGNPAEIPLQSLFGASNELPDSEELGALYDRFMLRYVIKYIEDDGDFAKMLTNQKPANPTTISLAELEIAQNEVKQVTVSNQMLELIIKIRADMKSEGIIASDRRYKNSISILQAHAWLDGRPSVTEDDMQILSHILWSQPNEIKTVHRVILGASNPLINKVMDLLDQSEEIFANCMSQVKEDPATSSSEGVEANSKLKNIGVQLSDIILQSKSQNRSTKQAEDVLDKTISLNRIVLKECLGLDIED